MGTVFVPRCPVIFDGLNYRDWFQHMRLHMRGQCLWEFLTGELPCPPHPAPPAEPVLAADTPSRVEEGSRQRASRKEKIECEGLVRGRRDLSGGVMLTDELSGFSLC